MNKKTNDINIVNNMIAKQELTLADKTDPAKYNSTINRIIYYLRENGSRAQTINDVQKEIKSFIIVGNNDFLKCVLNNPKLGYDSKKSVFFLKTKYKIKSKEELLSLIKDQPYGLVDDEELADSYTGIRKDIEALKKQNIIKVIKNESTKKDTLIYRDLNDPIEQILTDPKYNEALNLLRTKWHDEECFKQIIGGGELSMGGRIKHHKKSIKANKKTKAIKKVQNTHCDFLKDYFITDDIN